MPTVRELADHLLSLPENQLDYEIRIDLDSYRRADDAEGTEDINGLAVYPADALVTLTCEPPAHNGITF
jgi:hypothetical protein